jgi:hypothetical protein
LSRVQPGAVPFAHTLFLSHTDYLRLHHQLCTQHRQQLYDHLYRSTRRSTPAASMRLGVLILSLLAATWQVPAVFGGTVVHDGRFWPDHILRVSVAQVPSACEIREDVVVNGTSPGPALHLLPGARTWVRVYNDMTDRNLTMVRPSSTVPHRIGTAV